MQRTGCLQEIVTTEQYQFQVMELNPVIEILQTLQAQNLCDRIARSVKIIFTFFKNVSIINNRNMWQ